MFYFIPAWYHADSWSEKEQIWYHNLTHTEFDDTVKQIQLFHRKKIVPFQILLLSYAPNFRHFLHRQSVFRAPYWSCFDAIQEITEKKINLFSFHDLAWPQHVKFLYSPFAIVAMLHDKKYAQVEFGENGNLIQVDLFEEDVVARRNLYDDRGFLSSSIVYEKTEPVYQDFLTIDGTQKCRLFFSDGHVEINPESDQFLIQFGESVEKIVFSSLVYENLDSLIQEVFSAFLKKTGENDIFCQAVHKKHSSLLYQLLQGRENILSFYGERYLVEEHPEARNMISEANYVITDSMATTEQLRQFIGDEDCRMIDISPYDTREDVGISEQLHVQKVMLPVDHMPDELLRELILILYHYMEERENVRVCLFTRESTYRRKENLLDNVRNYLKENAGTQEAVAGENEGIDRLDMGQKKEPKFLVEQCITELEVSRCMQEQRLLLELREKPELYLQVMSISIGLPQIVMHQTQFMQPDQNGKLIQDVSEITDAMDFYLSDLKNWNYARMESYKIGQQYSTKVLVTKWKEVLKALEHDTSIATGE